MVQNYTRFRGSGSSDVLALQRTEGFRGWKASEAGEL
ncbi:hypothetical protein A2U01_0082703, partial [Trifolium medium]|nr:hypothetical protein [Trifolium medium]